MSSKLTLNEKRIIIQLRLLNCFSFRIVIDGKKFNLNDEKFCNYCFEENTFMHKLLTCISFKEERSNFLKDNSRDELGSNLFFNLIDSNEHTRLKELILYVKNVVININKRNT